MSSSLRNAQNEETRYGVAAALGAFCLWGLLTIFWKTLHIVNALEVVSHRGIWSLVCVLPVVVLTKRLKEVPAALKGRNFFLLFLATALIACNWLIFVWAVGNGHILETSLGNFMSPLFNMLCGVVFFRDRVSRLQWIAVGLVALSVVVRIVSLGYFPWIAFSLCTTFAFYGILRKIAAVEAIPGLLVENIIFTPFALGILVYLAHNGGLSFGGNTGTTAMLVCTGLATSLPMFLFVYAARHLRLTTLGIFHYISPTIAFFLGVFVYDEPFNVMNLATFAVIWLALIVYTTESYGAYKVKNRCR
jgi:chloramphenicol-sensitive protein RarD